MGKFALILRSAAIIAMLVLVKLAVHLLDLDVVSASPVITALIAGVIFTIAIIFTGTLADFKESEKIPGDLAGSIKSLFRDSRVPNLKDAGLTPGLQGRLEELLHTVIESFKSNDRKSAEIDLAIAAVDEDIYRMAQDGAPPPLIARMRNELTTTDKTCHRIQVIMETSFIAAAYHIAIIATGAVLLVLLFIQMGPFLEGLLLYSATAFVLISLLLLIKDMDNPFEVGKKTSADVDLSILFHLEDDFKSR
ncbi:MAG: hypothetical protein HY673_12875 [Chloroflexi bacterium]|nr:hypothetical protein [Chloroflexota bacterium]